MNKLTLLIPLSLLLLAGCSEQAGEAPPDRQELLRMAVTTSTRDSGLLDILVPRFEKKYQARVDVIAVGTGAALKLGEAGDVDLVLVHAREAEDAFMKAGHGIRREDVMYNTFELLGPEEDPADIRNTEPVEAMRRIASSGVKFVSRGDNSGTHLREMKLWAAAGIQPQWDRYAESGQGMGATLTIADETNAYVLTDRGTCLKFKSKIRLVPLVTNSEILRNPYGIIVVNPEKHPDINSALAAKFVDFIISSEAQQLIRDFKIEGESLFYPQQLSDKE